MSAAIVLAIVVWIIVIFVTVVGEFLVTGILLLVTFHSANADLSNGILALVRVWHARFVGVGVGGYVV